MATHRIEDALTLGDLVGRSPKRETLEDRIALVKSQIESCKGMIEYMTSPGGHFHYQMVDGHRSNLNRLKARLRDLLREAKHDRL